MKVIYEIGKVSAEISLTAMDLGRHLSDQVYTRLESCYWYFLQKD